MSLRLASTILVMSGLLALTVGCNDPEQSGQSSQTAPPEPMDSKGAAASASGSESSEAVEAANEVAGDVLGEDAKNLQPADPGVPTSGDEATAAEKLLDAANTQIQTGEPDWTEALTALAGDNSDAMLAGLSGDFSQTASALRDTFKNDPRATQVLDGLVKTVLGGDTSQAAGLYDTLSGIELTPEQKELATELGNVGSAFMAQRSFSGLEDTEGKVAKLVKSLRNGDVTEAIPVAKELNQMATLTPDQKDLLQQVLTKYAPPVKGMGGVAPPSLPAAPTLPR